MKEPLSSEIIKTYPQRGPMQQFRLRELIALHCFRCGNSKKSKLVVVYDKDWDLLLCNGCYGRLLAIFEIKSGTKSDDEKASELAAALLAVYNQDQAREAERLYQVAEKRASLLSDSALRFIATSEHLSKTLETVVDLDWSPVIIGLCKAIEIEVLERIISPLAVLLRGANLEADVKDKDIGRVARFLSDPNTKPPELGTFGYFLQTVLNSQSRRATSVVVHGFYRLLSTWPNSAWLSNNDGFYKSINNLTLNFRNRAAHIDTLGFQDYEECKDIVIGEDGMMWKLIISTQPHRR